MAYLGYGYLLDWSVFDASCSPRAWLATSSATTTIGKAKVFLLAIAMFPSPDSKVL